MEAKTCVENFIQSSFDTMTHDENSDLSMEALVSGAGRSYLDQQAFVKFRIVRNELSCFLTTNMAYFI